MEEDVPSPHTDGRLPILDLEVWVEEKEGKEQVITFSYYRKPMASSSGQDSPRHGAGPQEFQDCGPGEARLFCAAEPGDLPLFPPAGPAVTVRSVNAGDKWRELLRGLPH